MSHQTSRWRSALTLATAVLLAPTLCMAQETPSSAAPPLAWEFIVSPFTYHWHNDANHKYVYLLGLENHRPGNWMWGAGAFSNSFGQPSAYVYYGYVWDGLFDNPKVYAKISAGILYGYKGAYKDKVPFNHGGFSPLVVPAIGYRMTSKDALQIALLGNAGLLFSYNRRF